MKLTIAALALAAALVTCSQAQAATKDPVSRSTGGTVVDCPTPPRSDPSGTTASNTRGVNRWVSRTIIKERATENEAGERVGVFNKIFGYVYHVRLLGKRMKAWNRQAYYAMKYAIVALILIGIAASALG